MQRTSLMMLARIVVIAIAGTALAQPEQTPAELRTEIDLLKQRVAQLEAQLEAAAERADGLAAENRELRRRLAQRPVTTGDEKAADDQESLEVPIDEALGEEALPEAWERSPESLFRALQKSYAETMEGVARESRSDEQRYFALVGKWARDAERRYRGDVEWTVRVTRVLERPDRAGDVMMQVVNPETGLAWGEPFTMVLARAHRELLKSAPGRNYWRMAGTLTAKPHVNRERDAPGFFLHPLFIGAFAEFEYEFKVRGMTPTTLEPAPSEDEVVEPAMAPKPDGEP